MVTNIIRKSSNLSSHLWHIIRKFSALLSEPPNINDFVRTKGHRMKLVPFNEHCVNCDNTKSNWRYDHDNFDAIYGTEVKAENKKPWIAVKPRFTDIP